MYRSKYQVISKIVSILIYTLLFFSAQQPFVWAADDDLDLDFDPNFQNGILNATVFDSFIQTDGKIVVVGNFNEVGGTSKDNIARLNVDGSVDATFNASLNNDAYGILRYSDDTLLIHGLFSSVNGAVSSRNIARINNDGTLDASFNANVSGGIFAMALQADGKVVIAGFFTSIGGVSIPGGLARLNSDGSLDTSFNSAIIDNSGFQAASIQPDGKILIGGNFLVAGSVSIQHIARLNTDGSLDAGFNTPELDGNVSGIGWQSDGKILVGGFFTTVNSESLNNLVRLNANGTVDTSFDIQVNNSVDEFIYLPDGRQLLVGGFSLVNGLSRTGIFRLNVDETIDLTFDPVIVSGLRTVRQQSDGKILLGGLFERVNGITRNGFARLGGGGSGPPLPEISIQEASVSQDEGTSGLTIYEFEITRIVDISKTQIVNFTVSPGLANPASEDDFPSDVFPTGAVPFFPGQVTAFINVGIEGDTEIELDETFNVTISAPPPPAQQATFSNAISIGEILDDDDDDDDENCDLFPLVATGGNVAVVCF